MPSIDGLLHGLISPLALPAFLAGVLAALVVGLLATLFRRTAAARRLVWAIAVVLLAGVGLVAVLDRLAQNERTAERRALAQRSAELAARSLVPGSALACLDDLAGEAVENACEKSVFAAPQAAAAAVAYMAARLTLLADVQGFAGDAKFAAMLPGLRRAVELDRFGLAAHVLAVRDGCTAERCAAFAWLNNADVIKSNLRAQLFDQYVSRHAADWNKTVPAAEKQMPPPVASAPEPEPAKTPLAGKYDFPSAASIPPVSIMNAEPPLPKEATDARAAQTPGDSATVPMPKQRPPTQAAPPAPR